VRIARFDELAVSTGSEVSQLIGDTREVMLFTSYVNVWAKRTDEWLLIARHVGLLERTEP
jgi:hypothetical protein